MEDRIPLRRFAFGGIGSSLTSCSGGGIGTTDSSDGIVFHVAGSRAGRPLRRTWASGGGT